MPLPLPAAAGAFFGVFLGVRTGLATSLNLLAALELGGFSTKEVSVVRNVASTSSTPEARRLDMFAEGLSKGWFCGRLNESGTGACTTKSTISYSTHILAHNLHNQSR